MQACVVSESDPRRVLLLAPMRSELQPIVRELSMGAPSGDPAIHRGKVGDTEVLATTIGVGPAAAARTTASLLLAETVDHVVVCGIAGAVGPDMRIGEVIVPGVVIDGSTGRSLTPDPLGAVKPSGAILTVGELVIDPTEVGKLEQDGVVALDMESSAVGIVCRRLGVPWTVFRSISDRAGDGMVDDMVLGMLNENGSANVGAAIRLVLLHPGRIPGLIRLARDSGVAARAAAKAAVTAVTAPTQRA